MDDFSTLLENTLKPFIGDLKSESPVKNRDYPNLYIEYGAERAVGIEDIDCNFIAPRLDCYLRELPKALVFRLWWNSSYGKDAINSENLNKIDFYSFKDIISDDVIESDIHHMLFNKLRDMVENDYINYLNASVELSFEANLSSNINLMISKMIDDYFEPKNYLFIGNEINSLKLDASKRIKLKAILTMVAQESTHAVLSAFDGEVSMGSNAKEKYHILTKEGRKLQNLREHFVQECEKKSEKDIEFT